MRGGFAAITEAMNCMQENFTEIGSCLRGFSAHEKAAQGEYNNGEMVETYFTLCSRVDSLTVDIEQCSDESRKSVLRGRLSFLETELEILGRRQTRARALME